MASLSSLVCSACGLRREDAGIEFTRIPQADSNGRTKNDIIEGVVKGARPGQQLVLYARSGKWWVQPLVGQPFTGIPKSSKWTNATHLGTEYAALLVDAGYRPPAVLGALPSPSSDVAAVSVVPGGAKPPSAILSFSGYDWRVRDAPSARGGFNRYDPANAWVDDRGALHLKIEKTGQDWTCAEVSLMQSLGYGTYQFVVRDVAHLEPAAVFGMFTYDYAGGAEFRLLVRDDGTGIDSKMLESGQDRHWGLVGMRERAERIGAQLHVLSRTSAGTEIELSVPGHLAFQDPPRQKALLARYRR